MAAYAQRRAVSTPGIDYDYHDGYVDDVMPDNDAVHALIRHVRHAACY